MRDGLGSCGRPVWSGLVRKLPPWCYCHLPSGWRDLEYGGFLVRDPRVMGKNKLCGVGWGRGLAGVREQGHFVTTLVPGAIWLAAASH